MKAKKKKKISISNVASVTRYQFGNVAQLQRYQIGNVHMCHVTFGNFFFFFCFHFIPSFHFIFPIINIFFLSTIIT
jgi:hypothetical protein